MTDCLFCKIIAGEIPAEKVYEDEYTIAFLDIKPVNPGHTLVIPKNHSRNLLEISKEDWGHLMETARILASAVKQAVNADGINLEMNNEEVAGQVIFHTHVHIVPRFADDGLRHWPGTPYEEGEAEKVAENIRQEL